MPEVITIPHPGKARASDLVRVAVVLGPPAYLLHLWTRGRALHVDEPRLNLTAHALLVGLALAGGWALSREPVEKRTVHEHLIASQPNWRVLLADWWTALPLFAAAIVGSVVLAERALSAVANPSVLSTSPGRGLLIWLTCGAMAAIYMTMLFDREELRVSDEGIRWGITQFAEWERVARVAERGGRLWVFHRVNPDVPFGSVLDYAVVRADLDPYLRRHAVPRDDTIRNEFRVVRATSVFGAAAVTAGALALYFTKLTGPLVTVAGALTASFAVAALLEGRLGLYRTTRGKHKREPTRAGDITADPEETGTQDVTQEMEVAALRAVGNARERFRVELSFLPDSVRQIEQILGRLHEQHRERPLTEQELLSESFAWGAYVGAVIRKLHSNGRWQTDVTEGELPWLALADGAVSSPLRWCMNRIVNGPEDNVWHKFQILFLAARVVEP